MGSWTACLAVPKSANSLGISRQRFSQLTRARTSPDSTQS
jgi:hypothetical protein